MTDFQPTLPAEEPWTQAEIAFKEEEPPGFFPDNQDSNFGYIIRRVWCNRVQELIDQFSMIYTEGFVTTAQEWLGQWEEQLGLPVAPSGMDVQQRRSIILGRLQGGPFTRTLRNGIIEQFIIATFGSPTDFTTGGIPITGAGITMFAEAGDLSGLYNVIEDLGSWSYDVRIKNTITVDEPGLRRALERVTPSPFTFTISHVAIP